MDYLMRDSLHAGVPYGRHFDQDRLLASLCLDQNGESLAITEKGRTAAELMVFARYVMFSEFIGIMRYGQQQPCCNAFGLLVNT